MISTKSNASDVASKGKFTFVRNISISFLYFVVFVSIWAWYVKFMKVPPFLLPPPSSVAHELINLQASGQLWFNLRYTVGNIILGFLGGIVIGIPLGYLISSFRIVNEILRPYIVLIQAAPKIAIAPLLVLWFGLGSFSQLILIFALTFFPMMMAMTLGLSLIPRDLRTLGDLLGMTRWRYLWTVQLPSATPELISGAKIAIVDAMTGAFLSEFITSQRGLGYLMVLGKSSFNTSMLIAAVFLTVGVGLLGFGLVTLAEKYLLPWKR